MILAGMILFSFTHPEILLNSILAMFCASLIDSAFIMTTNSSANATVLLWLLYLKLRREMYGTRIFQKLSPQHNPCGQPLVMFFSILQLLIDITALLPLK